VAKSRVNRGSSRPCSRGRIFRPMGCGVTCPHERSRILSSVFDPQQTSTVRLPRRTRSNRIGLHRLWGRGRHPKRQWVTSGDPGNTADTDPAAHRIVHQQSNGCGGAIDRAIPCTRRRFETRTPCALQTRIRLLCCGEWG
jgi:hypothetical protein